MILRPFLILGFLVEEILDLVELLGLFRGRGGRPLVAAGNEKQEDGEKRSGHSAKVPLCATIEKGPPAGADGPPVQSIGNA